jgi:hypothetical protein
VTPTVLLVAKAPVPGFAKTRLAAAVGAEGAADVAAAALLDCLDAVRGAAETLGHTAVVALTGRLDQAARGGAIRAALRECIVLRQRGGCLGERLAAAHADTAAVRPGAGTLQVGMDTPQAGPDRLLDAVACLEDADGVIGRAEDGGWWVLGLRRPADAAALCGVPMSRPDTAECTVAALAAREVSLQETPPLRDLDTLADALVVAGAVPGSRTADAVRAVLAVQRAGR